MGAGTLRGLIFHSLSLFVLGSFFCLSFLFKVHSVLVSVYAGLRGCQSFLLSFVAFSFSLYYLKWVC